MGRTVALEERLRGEFEKLTATRQPHVGLLIGQLTSTKDYVVHFVRTPPLEEISKDNGEIGGVAGDEVIVQDWWVVEHARQVCALLAGGVSVVGVAIWCSTEQFKSVQLRVRRWLSDIASAHHHIEWLPHGNHILLHCPTNAKKSVCQTIDLSDPKAGFRPADLKYQSHFVQWAKLESSLTLDWATYCGSLEKEQELSTRDLLKPLLDVISGALLTVRGQPVKDGGELLIKTKKSSSQMSSSQTVKMGWLLKPYSCESSLPELLPGARRIAIRGCLSVVAYVPPKATYDDAVYALKQDAERSVLARTAALREASATHGSLCYEKEQLPCRVLMSLPNSQLDFSEYMLPNESVEECVGRVCELTGCPAADVKSQVLEEVSPPLSSSQPIAVETEDGRVVKSYSVLVSILAAVGVALLAIALWFVSTIHSSGQQYED